MANLDPAVEIARKFKILAQQFEMYYQDRPCKVRYERPSYGTPYAKDAELRAFTEENSACYFHVRFDRNDEDMVEPNRVNIDPNEADSANFQEFIKDVNDCINDFNITLRSEQTDKINKKNGYGVWIEAQIIDVHLSNSCHYHVNYSSHFSDSREVPARNVCLHRVRCTCGSYVPRDYLLKHLDRAVHLGHTLTKVYLRFLAEYKGHMVTVRGQQATLEETCKPCLDENIRFRLKLIENGEEIEESFQNIDFGHQCSDCRKVLHHDEMADHMETHGLHDIDFGLQIGDDVLVVRDVFYLFDHDLRSTQAIVYDEEHFEWVLVELLSFSLSESGCATYHVRHLQRNNAANEWVAAQNVRVEFWKCPQCITYFPRDEFQEHVSTHADHSG